MARTFVTLFEVSYRSRISTLFVLRTKKKVDSYKEEHFLATGEINTVKIV